MNILDEMEKINEYELHKRVVLIKIYNACLKIYNSRLSMQQKEKKFRDGITYI